MIDIIICARREVAKISQQEACTHVLSLLDNDVFPDIHWDVPEENCMLLHMEDTHLHSSIGPQREQVETLLAWGKALPKGATVLIHCEAGVSRSTAAALAIMVQDQGVDKIDECIVQLMKIRPMCFPNQLIIEYADDLLNCNGALVAAVKKIVHPFILGGLMDE